MVSSTKVQFILSFLLLAAAAAVGQTGLDSLGRAGNITPDDTLPLFADSLPPLPDSLPTGEIQPNFSGSQPIEWDNVKLSPDAPVEQIDYSANDSMYFDLKKKQIHLYGDAKVDYQTMNLAANYILIDWGENTMIAEGKKNSYGGWVGKPNFKQDGQDVTASKIRYNFRTYKGIIYDVQTIQQGMNVVGTKGKFLGAGEDTTKHNVIYNSDAIFSTCELEHPHFGIRSNKQKIVQDKVAIVGPSNLEIGGIPTPLWLPFGFFPIKPNKQTGLIFPRGYEFSERWGFGLEGVGWYFPVNDYWDLQLTGDVYLKGTFRTNAAARYRKLYKYNGNASMNFAYLREESATDGSITYAPSTSINWVHNQDAKAHPYRTLGGRINIQTSNFQKRNLSDAQSQLQTSLSSNMNFTQRFDRPFDLTASLSHSQNTKTGDVSVTFPTMAFKTETLFPFKRKLQAGGERWYEKISFKYDADLKNQFTAKDSTLFTKKTLERAQFGIEHSMSSSTQFSLLKYFNFTPSVSYSETWYFKTIEKTFDPTLTIVPVDTIFDFEDSSIFQVVYDTTRFGTLDTIESFGFKPLRQYNASLGMSTRIFGTLLFKKGRLRGLRHVISPTFNIGYTPDYTADNWGYYRDVLEDTRDDEPTRYSIFDNNRIPGFAKPSAGGRAMTLTYGFGNQIEAKVFSKKDKKDKLVKLVRTLNVGGSYNFIADSLNWSLVSLNGNQSFFNGITTFNARMAFDPYNIDRRTGRRIDEFYKDTNGKLLRLDGWNAGLLTNMTVGRIRDLIKGVNTDQREANETEEDRNKPKEQDLLSLLENFSISHNFTLQRRYNTTIQKDTIIVSAHTLNTRGNINLTPNWRVSVGNIGYDFQGKRITYPDFTFSRDLHCWEMGVSWQPFFETYGFYIRVKPGHLDFINIPYGRRIQDRGF